MSTINEIFSGSADYTPGPYGLGARVPMIVVSRWSKGGRVNSPPFDHTSIIRFIEQRFGLQNPLLVEPNITPGGRAVAGNLTSACDFRSPNKAPATLPSNAAFAPPDTLRHPDYKPVPSSTQSMPAQEPGLRRARAPPYRPVVEGGTQAGLFAISFGNRGSVGTVYQVRSGNPLDLPRTYTVVPA